VARPRVRVLKFQTETPPLLVILGVQVFERDGPGPGAGRFKRLRIMAHPLSPSKASTRQQNNPVFGLCARSTIRRHGTRPGTERYRNHDDSLSAPGQFALRQARQYRSNWNRSMVGCLSFPEPFRSPWRLAQPDAWAFAIFVDEDHAGRFEGGALRHLVATSHRTAGVDKTA